MEKRDVYQFKKLIVLSRKQLASIDERLSNPDYGKWNEFVFKIRHAKIKRVLSEILSRREEAVGEDAILDLIKDLEFIGKDNHDWQSVDKKESDYLRFVLHGIKAAPQEESNDREVNFEDRD